MDNIKFVKTEDNSVGLYSNEVNDIFHSKTGALREAFEKFIVPSFLSELFSDRNNKVNILDICYGIGYNTKAALNVLQDELCLNIDCLEFSQDFVKLSPFIFDSLNRIDINLFLLSRIQFNDYSFIKSLNKDRVFLDNNMLCFIEFLEKERYKTIPQTNQLTFLHNIYYNYITSSMKQGVNLNKYNKTYIDFKYGDARKSINQCNRAYDVVFLDAFSPQKDPTLWTIHFLSLVKNKMNDNSVLVSYSKSTPFRSALLQLGFYVGKTFIEGGDMGTVASLNKNKIKNPLTDYDIQLLNTRSGIVYKDPNLSLSAKEILLLRENEQKNSNLISHTQFLKTYKK